MGCGASQPAVLERTASGASGARVSRASDGKGASTSSSRSGVTSHTSTQGSSKASSQKQTPRGKQRPGSGSKRKMANHMAAAAFLSDNSGDLSIIMKDPARLGLSSDFLEGEGAKPQDPLEFSFAEIIEITDNFSRKRVIGEGGFGKVYRGRIARDDGDGYRDVAVKKLSDEGLQGFNEWLTEVIFLRCLRHPHLVGFVGYCAEEEHGVLVYEFMVNGSVDKHLFGGPSKPALTWEQRVTVALGAAKGLAYLHEGTGRPIIFRDLKAANILLDEDFNAKLSDFGLAKDGPIGSLTHVSTQVVGTQGYTAPEYAQTGHLTIRSDVYSFGVVLLELLTGRQALDETRPVQERNLVHWSRPILADKSRLPELMDPKLGDCYPAKAASKLAVVANCCVMDFRQRPTMVQLVKVLTDIQSMRDSGRGGVPLLDPVPKGFGFTEKGTQNAG